MAKHLLCIVALILLMRRFALSAPFWDPWGNWSSCNCNGEQVRTRECYQFHQGITFPATNCHGLNIETILCIKNETSCSPAVWSDWGDWSSCNCNGELTRTRECYQHHQFGPPTPATSCHGLNIETKLCTNNEISCLPAVWSDWGDWSSCNCNGELTRTRECYQHHQFGPPTPATSCHGLNIETKLCTNNEISCLPVTSTNTPGVWHAWSDWSNCSESCGNNIRIRVRNCTNVQYTKQTNDCQGPSVESLPCPEINCTSQVSAMTTTPPVSVMTTKPPDSWTNWSAWTHCTVTCGGGVTYRSRNCSTYNQTQANDCYGISVETESCNNNTCDDNVMHLSTFSSLVVMNTTTSATGTIAPGSDSSEPSTTTPASHTMSTSHPGSQHEVLESSTLSSILSMNTTTPATGTITPGSDSSEHSTTTSASHTMSPSHSGSQPQDTAANTTPVTTNVTQPQSISCFECTGDPNGCEYNYQPVTCSAPDNYCINDLTNGADASRTIIRRCGNYDECVNDWWQTYSDNELCKNFNQSTAYNVAFNCKFCCVKDGCNERINPPKEMNFVKN